jgi:hypothetical protein
MIPFLIALAAAAASPQTPADVFSGLAGSCFKSPMPQGASDTHCFTAATGGRLVMDVHAVKDASGKVVYQGVTVYTPSADGKVALAYSNSEGDVMPGTVTRAGDTLSYVVTIQGQAVPLSWTIKGDGYDVAGGPSGKHFTRIGVAGEGGL